MRKNKLSLKIILIIILVDCLETLTHFCFKKSAMPESGLIITNAAQFLIFARTILGSGFLWAGLISVVVTFIIWSVVLSKIDLSIAVPLCSFSYILIPCASILLLHEKISALRWLGILIILIGIIFVSMSGAKDEKITQKAD